MPSSAAALDTNVTLKMNAIKNFLISYKFSGANVLKKWEVGGRR
jgi:hypothetical protein